MIDASTSIGGLSGWSPRDFLTRPERPRMGDGRQTWAQQRAILCRHGNRRLSTVPQPGFQPEGISEAVQDYAKAIYALQLAAGPGQPVPTTVLAARLKVAPASASGMAKRLGELGLVHHVPYKGVMLTDA